MALSLDQISAITNKYFIRKMVDNIFDSDPLWKRSKEKGWYTSINGGTEIQQPLLYARSTASGSYSPTDTLNTTDNDQFTGAVYQWRYYYVNISISRADELKNSGDAQILAFVKQKTQAAELTLKDDLQDGLWGDGSVSTDIQGIQQFVSASNTVGGIPQSDYSFWQSQIDSSTDTVALAPLQEMYSNLTINGKGPTVVLGTRANYNRYYALLQPQQRFTDAQTAKAGFQSLMFNGVPFIASPKCPTDNVVMLNEEFVNIYYHPQENMRFEPFVKPHNQNVKLAKVYWSGNAGTSSARMNGRFTALSA